MNKKIFSLGLMSGTSADGVTVTLVKNSPFKTLQSKTYKYSKMLQQKLLNARFLSAAELSELNFEVGKIYAAAVSKFLKEFKIKKENIFAVGSHGQTIVHNPYAKTPNTLQIGEPAFLAARGLRVVHNFRAKDMALGGQGAPLMPFFDEYIFGGGKPKIILNVGGVANISVVGKNVVAFGFDTGPGNALMDEISQKSTNKNFDEGGKTAARGKVDEKILDLMMKDEYFSKRPPKSMDRNYFEKYLNLLNKKNIRDAMATLNMFTAKTIASAVKKSAPPEAKEIIVSGGGAFNKTLLKNISSCLPGVKISLSSAYGIDVMAKESAAFALFAKLALEGKTNHLPRATGAKQKTMLGSVAL